MTPEDWLQAIDQITPSDPSIPNRYHRAVLSNDDELRNVWLTRATGFDPQLFVTDGNNVVPMTSIRYLQVQVPTNRGGQ